MIQEQRKFSIVGNSVHRVDGVDKVTGKAKYTGDLVIPEVAEGKFLRSPYAHARIRSIDTREAEAMAGVIAVLTSKDFTDISPYMGRGKNKDHPIIAVDRAIFAGQLVAVVAAVDRATAEEAFGKIHVDYEELPAVINVDEAMADGAPRIHDFAERNICFQTELVKGDVEKGFAEADEIFEDTFEFPMIYHYSMEPHTAIAQVDSDSISVWTSTDHPFGVRQEIAKIFHYPLSKIRVHVNFVGGAYGSKSGGKIEPLVVALARKAQRPVRVVQSVSEAMATCRRHAIKCKVKTGVKKDGTLVAKQAEIYLNTGAYTETGPIVTGRTLTRILGPYRYPNLKINSYCVYTNTVSAVSFRSIGGPQTAWATESQMDIIAQKLGLDPVALRLKNLVKKGEEIRPKFRPLDADLAKGFKLVVDKLGWDGPVAKDGRGRGVGCGTTDPGAPLASTSTVHVLADGSVVVLCGTAADPPNPLFWEIGIGAVEVDVDRETGKVHVAKYVTAADAGKALHPLQCEGQDEGSAMMGFGHTFYESYYFEAGQIINSSMVDYKVPTFDDVPEECESILIEDCDGPGPHGSKGLGEGGIIPVAPAVANAIAWSTGARIRTLPLTPEKVWRALQNAKKEQSR